MRSFPAFPATEEQQDAWDGITPEQRRLMELDAKQRQQEQITLQDRQCPTQLHDIGTQVCIADQRHRSASI